MTFSTYRGCGLLKKHHQKMRGSSKETAYTERLFHFQPCQR